MLLFLLRTILLLGVVPLLFFFQSAAAAPAVVGRGEPVRFHMTCRFADGRIVTTTDPAVAADPQQPKWYDFRAENAAGPLSIVAGTRPEPAMQRNSWDMQPRIVHYLANQLIGLPVGETRSLRIDAPASADPEDKDRYSKLNRVRQRRKEMPVSLGRMQRFAKGRPVEVGAVIEMERGLPVKITAVDGNNVRYRYQVRDGETIDYIFGPARIVYPDTGELFQISLDPQKNQLVRVLSMIGRVIEVDEGTFTLDQGHPFGGQPLFCEVTPLAAGAGVKVDRPAPKPHPAMERAGEGTAATAGPETADRVQPGDLIQAHYSLALADGTLVVSTRREIAAADGARWAEGYGPPAVYDPVEAVAGEAVALPGLGQKVVGMALGERRSFPLPAAEAFGDLDGEKELIFNRVHRLRKVQHMTMAEFDQRFHHAPVNGAEEKVAPDFNARVTSVADDRVALALECDAQKIAAVEKVYPNTVVTETPDEVILTMTPEIGATIQMQEKIGRVKAMDDQTFTVDYNHPLAGRDLSLDLEIVSITKPSGFRAPIDWQSDYVAAREAAEAQGKPMVLVLYAHWCGWSKRLFQESCQDPRIRALRERYVWVRVDVDARPEAKDLFNPQSFPTILVMRPNGEVVRRLEGWRSGEKLKHEIQSAL